MSLKIIPLKFLEKPWENVCAGVNVRPNAGFMRAVLLKKLLKDDFLDFL